MGNSSVNKVIIVGNLGSDPEVRYMPNGQAVANITVATSESWKDQQGQYQERTEWHRIVLYRRLAEVAGEYLRKGSKIYLEGRLQTREWLDTQQQKRFTTEVIGIDLQMLDNRGAASRNAPAHPAAAPIPPAQNNWGHPSAAAAQPQTGYNYDKNTIPPNYNDDLMGQPG